MNAPRHLHRLLPAAVVLLAATVAPAEPADREVATSIESVTVYSDRAVVTRTGSIRLPSGVHELRLSDLPATARRDSFRGRITTASGRARVLTVDGEVVRLEADARPEVVAARDAFQAAERAQREASLVLEEARAHHQLALSAAESAAASVRDALASGATPELDRLLEATKFAGDGAARARTRLASATAARRDADHALSVAKERLDAVRSAGDRLRTAANLTVAVEQDAEVELQLTYSVGQAGWAPVYAVRAETNYERVEFEVAGRVWQRSGEDWDGVRLELSTAQPALGAAPPEPERWTVGLRREVEADAPPAAKAELQDARPAPTRSPSQDANFDAQVRRSGVSIAFVAPERSRVRSDGRPHRVSLARHSLDAEPFWVTVPSMSERVYVATELTNTTGTPFPAGELSVFVGPDHVGRGRLDDWNPDADAEFGLGVDPLVDVDRETLSDASGAEGWIDEERVHRRAYRVVLGNHRERELVVRVRDHVPVSRDERIRVEGFQSSVAPHRFDEDEERRNAARGFVEWRIPVQPGGERELRFQFDVRHPESWSVSGL